MTNEGDHTGGTERQDDEALWALLGRQEAPAKVSPYFSRRVLREIALAEDARPAGWWGRVRRGWPGGAFARRGALWSGAFSGACAVLLLVLTHTGKTPESADGTRMAKGLPVQTGESAPAATPLQTAPPDAVATAIPEQDLEVIADLDNVLQREESRLWTEDTARF